MSVLVRVFGDIDIDIAEEAVQDAFTTAVLRWPVTGVPPSPAGWIITTARHRAIDRLRREASRADRYAQAALLYAPDEPAGDGRPVRDDRLRLNLHLLPPRARPRGPGRPHPAAAGRAHHRRDRPRLPGARTDHDAAARTRQGQDPRRRDPLPDPARRRSARPARRGHVRRVSDLQRGLYGRFGRPARTRRPLYGGPPPRPAAGRPHARRTLTGRAGSPVRTAPSTARRAHRCPRSARASPSGPAGAPSTPLPGEGVRPPTRDP